MKNKAAKLSSVGKIELFEEDISYNFSSGDVLVKMTAVGICGSDIHYFDHGGLGSFKQPLPMQLGHEPAGVVVDAPPGSYFRSGDRVAIEPGFSCYECSPCFSGRHNLCDNVEFMGANAIGALREYSVLHKDQLVKIPDLMSDTAAALLEPAGIALHAFNLLDLSYGSSVAIVGAGPIGLCTAIYARKMGITPLLIDRVGYRVGFAKSLGFEASIVGSTSSFRGLFDAAFDAAGDSDSFNLCADLCAKSATIAIIGIPATDYINVNPHTMRIKELKVQNVRRANQTLNDCMEHFSDDPFILERMVTHRYQLDDVQKAFELVSDKDDRVIKCMIDCWGNDE